MFLCLLGSATLRLHSGFRSHLLLSLQLHSKAILPSLNTLVCSRSCRPFRATLFHRLAALRCSVALSAAWSRSGPPLFVRNVLQLSPSGTDLWRSLALSEEADCPDAACCTNLTATPPALQCPWWWDASSGANSMQARQHVHHSPLPPRTVR